MKKMKMYLGLSLLILLAVCSMASAAAAEKKVSLHDDLPFVNGMTTISWDVNEASTTRYVVTYKVINNGTAAQSALEAGRTYDNSVETAGIIPGKCYEITVSDIMGNVLDQKAYRMDDAETYTDGNLKNTSIKVYVKPSMMEYGKNPKQVSGLTGLRELYLDSNRITDLSPVEGLPALERLSAEWNPAAGGSAPAGAGQGLCDRP